MTVNVRLWIILAAFFLAADVAYVIWNIVYHSQQLATDPLGGQSGTLIEWTGTVVLGLSAVLSGLIAFYLARVNREQGLLPEDRPDAVIDDGDAEQGFFSPFSWWPIALAGAIALVFIGVSVGLWLAFLGIPLVAISLVGWIYQYYRGYFAH